MSSLAQKFSRNVSLLSSSHQNHDINQLLTEEKDVLKSLKTLSKEKTQAARALATWGKKEYDDILDVSEKVDICFENYNEAILSYIEKYEIYRLQLKDIRNKQEELQALYNKQEKIGKSLKDAHKKNKPTDALTEELANLEITVGHTEADLFFIKRKSLHTGLMMQFEGMKELASKMIIIADFGKHLTEQIPVQLIAAGQEYPRYDGQGTTQQILTDMIKQLNEVKTVQVEVPLNSRDRMSSVSSVSLTNDGGYTSPPPTQQKQAISTAGVVAGGAAAAAVAAGGGLMAASSRQQQQRQSSSSPPTRNQQLPHQQQLPPPPLPHDTSKPPIMATFIPSSNDMYGGGGGGSYYEPPPPLPMPDRTSFYAAPPPQLQPDMSFSSSSSVSASAAAGGGGVMYVPASNVYVDPATGNAWYSAGGGSSNTSSQSGGGGGPAYSSGYSYSNGPPAHDIPDNEDSGAHYSKGNSKSYRPFG